MSRKKNWRYWYKFESGLSGEFVLATDTLESVSQLQDVCGTHPENMSQSQFSMALRGFAIQHAILVLAFDDQKKSYERKLKAAVDIFCGGTILLTLVHILILILILRGAA